LNLISGLSHEARDPAFKGVRNSDHRISVSPDSELGLFTKNALGRVDASLDRGVAKESLMSSCIQCFLVTFGQIVEAEASHNADIAEL
jgi:hypothetical protein